MKITFEMVPSASELTLSYIEDIDDDAKIPLKRKIFAMVLEEGDNIPEAKEILNFLAVRLDNLGPCFRKIESVCFEVNIF